jgi:hypothetical protein
MHEAIDESSNFTNICIIWGENAYLWRNFNVICSVHTFFYIFSNLSQSLKFRGWNRFDGIRRIHSIPVLKDDLAYISMKVLKFFIEQRRKFKLEKTIEIVESIKIECATGKSLL